MRIADEPFDLKSNGPNNIQSVERSIKLTTKASSSVAGEEKQDAYSFAVIDSRKANPKTNSKQDFLL